MHIHTHVCVYIYTNSYLHTCIYMCCFFWEGSCPSFFFCFFVFYLVHRTLRVWSLSSTQPMNLQQHEAYSYSQYQHLNCHSHLSSHQTQPIKSRKHSKCQPQLTQKGQHIIPCWFMTSCIIWIVESVSNLTPNWGRQSVKWQLLPKALLGRDCIKKCI